MRCFIDAINLSPSVSHTQVAYRDISVQLTSGSSDGGTEKTYNAAPARFAAQLARDHAIRVVDLKLKK